MAYQDKTLECRDCGGSFTFTAGEQDFFATKGFDEPSRCPNCRKQKKARRQVKESPTPRPSGEIYEIICSSCGKKVEVPFRPRNPHGVLCAQCFESKQLKK